VIICEDKRRFLAVSKPRRWLAPVKCVAGWRKRVPLQII